MKAEKLFDKIGQIDDGIIAEANSDTLKITSAKRAWLRMIFAAACIVVAVITAVTLKQLVAPPDEFPELPMLTISEDRGAYGFEGYMAYNINQLKTGNPWSERDVIKILPVFQNPASFDEADYPVKGLSAEEMIKKAREAALTLKLTIDSVYTKPTEEDLRKEEEKVRSIPGHEEYKAKAVPPYEAIAVCGDVTISVTTDGKVGITFEKGVPLPDNYSFTYYDTSEQQAKDAVSYLLEQYKSIVAMKSPAPDLFGDYSIDAQRLFSYSAYENNGSLTDRILSYNFNRVSFFPNDDGVLGGINRYAADLSQKIGDYPIITAKNARKLLLQKRYITTVPEEFPDEKYIAGVELIYRTGRHDEVFMPYYRFLVELPTMQKDNGLKTFGAFYVPAVEERYLTNMPLWDGSFN